MSKSSSINPISCTPIPAAETGLRLVGSVLVSLGLVWAPGVSAQQNTELVNLINEYRNSPARCDGRQMEAVGPLAPNPKLAAVALSSGQWQTAMQKAGYQASAAQFVQISGPSSADQVMDMVKAQFCRVLRSGEYAEIGVSHADNQWLIVLARPLVTDELKDRDWMDVGQEVLLQVNLARRESRTCGDQEFEAAHPLTWDGRLARAALEHSRYMAEAGVLSHAGREGEQVESRVDLVNYKWRTLGENVAVGQSSPEQVVAAWLHSPGHCVNIMNPEFTDMGAAFGTQPQTSIYWTQVFGSER